ncbi:MAG: helix-hairpin-helix domain-containing protein [Candidatus Contendobacter sp.]|nr:helix-hairpin-helix domain-containing protein [Candidatus Contendobacter sp.]
MKLFQLFFGLILAFCSTFAFAQAIDINTASVEQLDKGIKGIGPARATAIVKYREANGPFKSVDDLTKVPGIKEKALDKLLANNKDMLTVGGAATVPAAPAVPVVHAAPKASVMPAAPVIHATPVMPAAPVVPAAPIIPAVPAVPAK